MSKQRYEVPSVEGIPPQYRRVLNTMSRLGLSLFGRPQFPRGLIVGEGKNAIHLTPERLQRVLDAIELTKK